jgi:hypothetical protein
MVKGLPELLVENDGICRGCALGKNAKGYFPSSDNKSKGILDLVHSDECGFMKFVSLGGFMHYVTFIDDLSHGLKQEPRAWYSRIDGYLMTLGFTKSEVDPNLYYKVVDGDHLIFVLYVDAMFLMGEESLIVECKREIASKFEMKDLDLMHYFLGLEVWKKPSEIFLGQGKYTIEILSIFGMMDCKSMATPMMKNMKKLSDFTLNLNLVYPTMYMQLIGSLMYLVNTMLDICFALSTLSQFMVKARHFH